MNAPSIQADMAAIILSKDGVVMQTIPLLKERTTIGRRTYNDVVIDEPGVSAEHAVIVLAPGEPYFQDLYSTNGSRINGQPAHRHFLQDGDIVEFGQHAIVYHANGDAPAMNHSMRSDGTIGQAPASSVQAGMRREGTSAFVEILNGHYAGRKIPLTQPLTTVGRPNRHVAVLARQRSGYSLTHVEGKVHPLLNGQSIGLSTRPLADGDLVDLEGTQLRFFLRRVG